MQRTQKLDWLGKLTVLGLLAAGAAQAATLTINSGNVVWGSSGTGTAQIRYAAFADAYYLNTNTSSAWLTGYQNGLDTAKSSHYTLYDEGARKFICSSSTGSTPAVLVWNYNTSGQLIQSANVLMHALIAKDGTQNTSLTWDISTDGSTWTPYLNYTSAYTDSAYHDITSYVKGYSNFYIKVTLYPYNSQTTPQLFRSSMVTYGMDATLVVPEPASLGLLALSGLFVLRRKPRRQ